MIEATIYWLDGLIKQKRSGLKAASLSNEMKEVGYGLQAMSILVTFATAILPVPSLLPPPVMTKVNVVVLKVKVPLVLIKRSSVLLFCNVTLPDRPLISPPILYE